MLTKHFWKTLFLFIIMVLIALLGIFWLASLEGEESEIINAIKSIAK